MCPASSLLLAEPVRLGHQIDNVIDPSIGPCWPLRPIRLMVAGGLSFISLVSFHVHSLFVGLYPLPVQQHPVQFPSYFLGF